MLVSVSWRNIWRNKLRSSVILIAVALGVFVGVFTWAFYGGMVNQRINSVIKTEVSHIQIHASGYMEDTQLHNALYFDSLNLSILDTISDLEAYSTRLITSGMMVSAKTGTGVQLIGINPDDEKEVTNIAEKLQDGKYLEGIKRNPIVIGESLANKLQVKLRSRLVVSLQQMDGEITRAQFRVAGIYKTSNSMYDQMNAFVRTNDLKNILNTDLNFAHEIAIIVKDNDEVEALATTLSELYPDLDVRDWRKLMPEVSLIEESMNIQMLFIIIIILLALGFGIVNTMLMAVLERVKELGMLMAVGMNKLRVFMMIMLETIFLALTGGLVGVVAGTLFSWGLGKRGMDLSQWSEAYARMGFDTLIYPSLEWGMVIQVTVLVIITGIIGSIPPAIKALRLRPADAIRTDL
jgi:putative ABC transport system permease protein